MADIDLSTLSLNELKKLQKDVNRAIDTFHDRLRQEAIAATEAKAKEFGFSLVELIGTPKKGKLSSPPVYRHPEKPSVTWSGRGRQPAWIKDAIAAGKSKEDFLM